MFAAGQVGAGSLGLVSSPVPIIIPKNNTRRINRTARAVTSENNAAKSSGNLDNLQDPEAPYLR
jgi:hypothetical protein